MAELQEVQITEEKPLLPGQTPEVAKVIRDPLTPRPEFQTSKPPHFLPFQIQNLILTHTPTLTQGLLTCCSLCPEHVLTPPSDAPQDPIGQLSQPPIAQALS